MTEFGLRAWNLDDAESIAGALNNKKVLDNLRDGLPYPYTAKDAGEYIQFTLNADRDKVFVFAVTVEGKAVGNIGVFRQENIHSRTAELGYYLGEPYWGRGIMSGAVRQVCEQIFNNTDILRIYAEPFSFNAASCRVLEKAGFSYEGTLRQNAVKNGEIIDMKMYSVLKSDFLF